MFYEPVRTDRYFTRTKLYSDVDWTKLDSVVDAFAERIGDWYLDPIRYLHKRRRTHLPPMVRRLLQRMGWQDPGHFAFTVMALDCLLIDALSQFVYGEMMSRGGLFRQFIRDHLPGFSGALSPRVKHYGYTFDTVSQLVVPAPPDTLNKLEAVIWNGFRCGILHQAHAPLYCSIDPGGKPIVQQPSGKGTYATGYIPAFAAGVPDCPSITINPWLLFEALELAFGKYVRGLKDRAPANEPLRTNFKNKFTDAFGIDIRGLI